MSFIKKFLLAATILLSISSYAQNNKRAKLEKQKKVLQKEIAYVNSLIKQNKKASKYSVEQVVNINKKISIRESIIGTINSEVTIIDKDIKNKEVQVDKLDDELKNLKNDYARMINQTYRSKSSYNRLMFLLSSDNFNQALKRLEYMDQYSKYRKQQGIKIEEHSDKLAISIAKLKEDKENKISLISSKEKEKNSLETEKGEKESILSNLQQKNKRLVSDIKYKQRRSSKLQSEIQKIIIEEIRIAREKAKKENVNKKGSSYTLTSESKALANNFKSNKNKLPWPVARGVVVSKYGKHPHPTMKNIIIINHGVDIATEKGSEARSVFEGVVTSVIISKGGAKTILIQHGNYYTVYSNLSKIYVKNGQKVSTKQKVGEIYTNSRTGSTILKFQLWFDKNEQNPSSWIYKM